MSMYRRSLDTLARYSLSQVVAPLVALAFSLANARQMPLETYGNLALLVSATGFMTLLAGGWLDRTLLRFASAAARPHEVARALGATALLGGIGLLLAGLCAAGAVSLGWLPIRSELPAFLAAFIAQTVTTCGLLAIYRARGETVVYPLAILITTFAYAAGGYLAFKACGSIEALLWVWAAAWTLAGVFVATSLRARGLLPRPHLTGDSVTRFLRYGLPLLGASIGSMCLDQSDRFVLARYAGAREVALYSAGYLFGGYVLAGVGSIFTAAGFPHLISTWETEGEGSTRVLLARLTRLYILCAMPAAAGVSILSQRIIGAFLGAKYADAASIVCWIAAAYFISGLNQYEQAAAQLRRKTWLTGAIYAACAALNLLLNLSLIPRFGMAGAAWATLAGYIALFVVTAECNRRFLGFAYEVPRETWVRALFSTACMAAAVFLADSSLPATNAMLAVAILGGMAVYAGALHVSGELQESEYGAIRSFAVRTAGIGRWRG